MKFIRKEFKGSVLHYLEEDKFIMGFTEINSEIEDVGELFGTKRIIQMEQIHGNTIYFSDEIIGYPDGDGIIVNKKNVMAVIRTADCIPLFFWTNDSGIAGVIHIGWRGLHAKIVERLLAMMKQKGTGTNESFFFNGPAIEGKCYTVQQDVVDKFKGFSFSEKIFTKISEGYSMDVTKGIELCLINNGIPAENIFQSDICTFCDPRFPSYRRGDREKRIFNFTLLQ